jgi:amyloid beta precursor protein binding protein 1
MKAKSADYVKLQNIYKAKARKDMEEVIASVRVLETKSKKSTPVPDTEVEAFCKNASHVKVVRGTPLPDISQWPISRPDTKPGQSSSSIHHMLEKCKDDPDSLLPLWFALQLSRTSEFAWTLRASTDTLAPHTPADVDSLATHPLLSDHLAEIARCAGSELHNISSFTGGMVAQEAIKVITRQYVPVDNTCVFDGIRAKVWVGKIESPA